MGRETPILDQVRKIIGKDKTRFHMPGHKGDSGFFGGELLLADITEIPGADNLMSPKGVIEKSQLLFAKRVSCEKTFYSVSGTTTGILAAINAVALCNDKIIIARDCHLSVANALCQTGATPVFVAVEPDSETGILGCVGADDIANAIAQNPDAKAVFITYPNYFGLCCDLNQIAKLAHSANMPLIVDGAHSANFPYSALLPMSPAQCGADVWIASLHKTLPALNQCSVINMHPQSLIDPDDIERSLKQYQTTSPSYLLLSSIDYVSAYMADAGSGAILDVATLMEEFVERSQSIEGLTFPYANFSKRGNIFAHDCLKLIIDVSKRGISGEIAATVLASNGVFVEMWDKNNILLILSVADTKRSFDELYLALKLLPRGIAEKNIFNPYIIPKGECYISPKEAYRAKRIYVPLDYSQGLTAAEHITVYPPGIPCVIMGEEITAEMTQYINNAMLLGYDIIGMKEDNICVMG